MTPVFDSCKAAPIRFGIHSRKGSRSPRCGVAVLFLAVPVFWLLLKDPRGGAEAVTSGLLAAVQSVLPSLFPCFVLGALLTDSGLISALGMLLSRPFRFLFGISGQGAGAFLLGILCGFPVGAAAVSSLYSRGALESREAERLLFLSASPSLAFLLFTVGALFESPAFGRMLLSAVLLSAVTVGVICRLLLGSCTGDSAPPPHRAPLGFSTLFTGAISSAVASSLSVTGYIVFFSVLLTAFARLLPFFGIGESALLILSGITEVTAGCKKAAETASGLCGRVLCGFFAGFGGLCAHLQVIATVERPLPDRARRISFRSYFICKLSQGLLTALLVCLFSAL